MNKTLLSFMICAALSQSLYAEIVTDGSLGASSSLSGAMTIPQSLGTTKGNNLFHSFSRFNINTGETATFKGSNTLKNVISRVTGGQLSTIDGTLKSEIGNANFYFINPAGITFGLNAQIDIPASFYVSTADYLKFSDNTVMSANTNSNTLSIAEPIGFGFINTQGGDVKIQNSNIKFKQGNDISFSGRNIIVDNGRLTAQSGMLHVYAVGNTKTELPLNTESNAVLTGNINLSNTKMNVSGDEATGSVGGEISLRGGDILLNNTYLDSNTFGSGNAGNIFVTGRNITLNDGHLSSNAAGGSGDAGNIVLNAQDITVNGIIESDTYDSTGNAGNIDITSDNLTVNDLITSDTYSSGNSGSVTVSSNTLNVLKNGRIRSNAAFGSGDAGDVFVSANQINVEGYIGTDTDAQGKGGNVSIAAKQLNIINNGVVSSSSHGGYGSGNAGNVFISSDNLAILNGGYISSDTTSLGNAGDVIIDTNTALIDGQGKTTGITSESKDNLSTNAGNAGNIFLSAKQLTLVNQGIISSDTQTAGDAGNISINANQTVLNGYGDTSHITGITSDSLNDTVENSGRAGNILINTQALSVLNEAQISSDTYGIGDAGDVNIHADTILLNGFANQAWISSDSLNDSLDNSGNAGNISISARYLNLLNRAKISTATVGTGNAGVIDINNRERINVQNNSSINSSTSGAGSAGLVSLNAPLITLDNSNISAQANSTSQGQTGDININASQALVLNNNANINIKNNATISNTKTILPSSINIVSPDIALKNSEISTESTGNIDAGDININFLHWLTLDPSFISTAANTGNGGDINIIGGQLIYLKDSAIQTSVKSAKGNGGNINIAADYLALNTGAIQANAVGGSGGNINLKLQSLISSKNRLILGGRRLTWRPFSNINVIQAASDNGINGTINVTSPQFDISASISGLDTEELTMPKIDENLCDSAAMLDSSLSRIGKGGIPSNETRHTFIPPTNSIPINNNNLILPTASFTKCK